MSQPRKVEDGGRWNVLALGGSPALMDWARVCAGLWQVQAAGGAGCNQICLLITLHPATSVLS